MKFPWTKRTENYKPTKGQIKRRDFAAAENSNFFDGWTTQTSSINSFLRTQLTAMRARSREQSRNNPIHKRAVGLMQKNIVGANGIVVFPRVVDRVGEPDAAANTAIKSAWVDWGNNSADVAGQMSFTEICGLWIRTAAVDGEYLARIHNTGEYGLQLENLDPELLDVGRNQEETNGNITRLGVEYSGAVKVAFWFRSVDVMGNYYSGNPSRVLADNILHCHLIDWPNQARGIPWGYSSLARSKHLDAYDEAALVAARAGAAKMGFFQGGDDNDDETSGSETIMDFSAGTFEKLGEDETFIPFDPTYPTENYESFTKKGVRDVGAGWDLSYASLSGDMSDVNYSSIRYGGQDERDGFIDRQNWLIRCSVKPIYEAFIRNAVLRGKIKIGNAPLSRPVRDYYPAHYQGRRWVSTDPQKEARGNQLSLEAKLTSPQRVIASRGDDPQEILAEIKEWEKLTEGFNNEIKEPKK